MGRAICHIDGLFFEWSTVSDGPVTYGMTFEEFENYYREENGRRGMEDLPKRMARAVERGTSFIHKESLESLLDFNREAGDKPGTMAELLAELVPPEE